MIETLHTVAAFVVAIALLIAVHEFGHFIVARKLGVKVEKFSIGFGPALLSWRSQDKEVLYVIAAIPLGGYVKMLGENPDEQGDEAKVELSEEDRLRSFDVQPVWKRASIAVAGPLFNFLFAIVAYMIVGWGGQSVLPPVIGHVAPASLAEQSGLLEQDRILTAQGVAVHSWQQVEEIAKDRVGHSLSLLVNRGGSERSVEIDVPQTALDPLLINVAADNIGMGPGTQVVVADVVKDSPADLGGLRAGDVVIDISGSPVSGISAFIDEIRAHAGKTVPISVKRGDVLVNLAISPQVDNNGHGRIGAKMATRSMLPPEIYHMSPIEGVKYGFVRTWEMTYMTLDVLGKMLTSAISPENLGGPIAIAQIAGKTAELGLIAFISFLALISVNLGVLNLLPIPVLDGGHLIYLAIEKLKGSPLSPKLMERTQIVGIVLIGALMIFAFYNDISRWLKG
ncbi:MAG: RIP metalloprotease RseP [Zetaproteobacteria bacterium CG06_land_8_20_14_3_00_59_53]|nr:MAG: RIP metalloprotease RseP [Zetaproteobacteria bacterium CG2_30_59_37]PIO90434.1 MAG: RIP metalloprotease RseP [Zetaproteobacteria bacterium CG23_combo_of_CG06-09_8_20_14_all_59_86]PIQ65905.1 MAG: RIP metalloprotease RseP [Zetaproteobacteria bacterium CG11_big_fil_rev_8_21_14_0_20_59_439]PIU71385.1 MAG: RIP metalloprotease RseP [Zetaproteobacteria bacterium CG06_land_8_20_14_3_00_59_53]PIU97641.1 MAG: RIP metalloprotease RseP [Zetaproteobacteria bacterium CG03_land_8_20_14_0_80_59_51]PIY